MVVLVTYPDRENSRLAWFLYWVHGRQCIHTEAHKLRVVVGDERLVITVQNDGFSQVVR